MTSDYTVSDLKSYMEDRLGKTSSNGLFEFEFQSRCRKEIESLGLSEKSGEGLLFTFAAIAGGWQTDVGQRLLDSDEPALGISDDFEEIASADLTVVDEKGYGGHPHRHANGAYPSKALNSLARTDPDGESVNSMSEVFESLSQADPDHGFRFDQAMSLFSDLKTFGDLSSFDYLDCAVRVNKQEWLTPEQLQVTHVNRNGPGQTLERVVANRGGNSENLIESQEASEILRELQNFAKNELGLSHADAFFDVESCLCTYHGDLENEGPDWRGSCT